MQVCGACGGTIADQAAFCTQCGADLQGGGQGVAQVLAPPPVTPPRPAPAYDPPGSGSVGGVQDPLGLDELLGQGAPNATYMGNRMLYEKEEQLEEFDPLKSSRFYSELMRRFLITTLIWAVGCVPIFIVGLILTFASHTAGAVLWGLLLVVWSIAMLCVFWLQRLPGQLSEWKFTLDGKGDAAPMVFDHIAWSLKRRETPLKSLNLRRFSVMGEGRRDVLELRRGFFYGLVSCFSNGSDLYIGWTFWIYMSPLGFLVFAIRRLVWELRFRGHAMYVALSFDRAKAMREALHTSVREGVDVAAGRLAPQGAGTIGSQVPVIADSLDQHAWGTLGQDAG